MIRFIQRAVAATAFILGATGGAVSSGQLDDSSTARLTVLHTSDIHGQVMSFDDARNQAHPGGLARVSTVVDQVRRTVDHPVLVLDSGDTIQGSPFERFLHVEWSEPSPTITAMNLIRYDAMAVGNHEFNFGLDVLGRARSQAEFPFLSANTIDEATGDPAFPPYLVAQAGPVRVGILGLVTPNIPAWERPDHYRGLRFEAMDEAARRWVPVLRNDEGCDVVIVLAHSGFERDFATGAKNTTGYENYGDRLSRVEGIDLLLTGHAHDKIDPVEVNGVIVSQPLARARYLTRIDLRLERDGTGWRIAGWDGTNLSMAEVDDDPKFAARFEPEYRRLTRALDTPITRSTEPVSVRGCRLADCAALDLIHTVQLETSGADLSLASLLTDGTPDLPAGPVTWRWVYGLYVYPNTLQVVEVDGVELKEILEHAARYYEGIECSRPDGCVVLTNPAVQHYNVDNVSGLTYRIDPSRPAGDRVRDLRFRGHSVGLHSKFKLVCNNYRAAGGGGYPHLAEAESSWTSSAEVADLIGEYLGSRDTWHPTVDGNWWVGRDLVLEETRAADRRESSDDQHNDKLRGTKGGEK
jgi:2',3'-cyclic-nucleotide 2'-phosphodiesterase/3'-nucleotidase